MNRTVKRLIIAAAVLAVSAFGALLIGAAIAGAAEEDAMRHGYY